MTAASDQSRRIAQASFIFACALVAVFILLLGRVVQLKVAPDPRLLPAAGASTSTLPEMARRGDLLDRAGRLIATSHTGYRLFVDPQEVKDLSTIAVDLGELLQIDPMHIDQEIAKRPESRYVVISHLLEEWQVEAVRSAKMRGVGLAPRLVRAYPHGDLAASVVGKVGFEHTGLAGYELTFNGAMQPTDGKLTYLRDVHRSPLWIDPDGYQPGSNGEPVRLSIDLVVQEIAESRLHRAVEEYNSGGGRLIVADCTTGEILAMTEVLNARPGWQEQTEDPNRAIHPALGRNRCVTDPYEPGSTFKPFIWAYATMLGRAQLDEILPTPSSEPYRTPYGRRIRDVHYYGPVSWKTVLIKSLNSGMAIVAERLSHREMQEALKRFHFGSKTNLGFSGESAGIITPPRKWSKYTQSSVAMGHELAVTPVQMVQAFTAFCNDGILTPLRITAPGTRNQEQGAGTVREPSPSVLQGREQTVAREGSSSSQPTATSVSQRAIPADIARTARDAMRHVMTEGTGRLSQSERYQLFGKSGTAQLPKRNGKGYHEDRYVASFIAGAPFDRPRIIVLCVIDDPDRSKGHFGGTIAGPAVRDVVEQTLEYLGIAPDMPQEDEELDSLAAAGRE